jgi:hypothetical protein
MQFGRKRPTVTFSRLGSHGQFGNQLFQIAAAIGYGRRNGALVKLPRWYCRVNRIDYSKVFPLINGFISPAPPSTAYFEPSFRYADIPFHQHRDLCGNFQCIRYFENVRDVIQPLFDEPAEVSDYIDQFQKAIRIDEFDAVHIRSFAHPIRDAGAQEALPVRYYREALSVMDRRRPVIVCSDNEAYARNVLDFVRPNTELVFSKAPSALHDLQY